MPSRNPKPSFSCTFDVNDANRIKDAAMREGLSAARWMSRVVLKALKNYPEEFAMCRGCKHPTISHDRSGCTVEGCRCPKFER